MPLTPEEKTKTIENLRRFFNHTDAFHSEPGRPLEFSKQIESDVEEIIKAGLHKSVANWGKFCSDAREVCGYRQEQVAELLGVNHRTIQRQEQKNIRNNNSNNAPDDTHDDLDDIDPFYLEAFSLIYKKSPYELLGLNNPHLICPMATLDDLTLKYTDLIVTMLFDANNSDKLTYLETITKIGKLKPEKYRRLISILKDTTISQVFDIEPLDHLPKNHYKRHNPRHPLGLDPSLYISDDYHRSYVFWDACLLLNDLERHNPMRLHTLAQLAICDEKCSKALSSLMLNLGYPKDAKSLYNYHVDKLLTSPLKRRKQKNTSDAGEYVWTTIEPVSVNKEIKKIVFYYPDRSLAGILDEGKILVHNNSTHSTIHGYSSKLTEFLLALNYTSGTAQDVGTEEPQYDTSKSDAIYKISLQDGRIYGNEGMAILTEEQSHKIQQIIASVFSEGVYRDTLPVFFERKLIFQKIEEPV